MKITAIIFLLFLVACSSSDKKFMDYSHLSEPTDRDYIDHLASVGADYLANDETHEVQLRPDSLQYLDQIYERIVTNNELLFTHEFKPHFHVIKNKTPFIFSLPHAQFFMSSGLIEKYLKSEELFVAAIATEILKSDRNIYEKRIMIPLGFYNTEKMIQMTRLKQETKYQVNEWTYIVLKRSGYDPTAFLNWIQVQNRNTLDFSLHLGDAIGISKEEHSFKNFMTKQGAVGVEKKINEANSSKAFYKLLNNITSSK
ncbi:MAG: hypothetical protein PHY93_07955 [Bacteriovorax sp.]|nr:hypothetical protein [Bacteriovorax sp.]